MCVRCLCRVSVVAVVIFCLWYAITNYGAIPKQQQCDNLPSRLYVHPIYPAESTPIVRRDPRPAYAPRIRILPHSLCESNISVVFIVHSDLRNTAQRQFQRKQLDDAWLDTLQAKRMFVIGSAARETTENCEKEAKKYDDLLQVDTIEHYHNITYKAQAWIQLLTTCPHPPKFIIKLDDDVMIDRTGVEYLVNRYLSHKEYTDNDLGTYCQGMAYVFSADQLLHMRDNISRVQFLWVSCFPPKNPIKLASIVIKM
ncbi:unnamed protein product [Strongylus vulgaris]|uniref:Hexosyltransferase n=1 Tax=Strongylus vulgaris TaxID=40348 RepID=A0A3P7JMQ7_STRVU|nr:unnamed protein product [Strongylus vulgaris]